METDSNGVKGKVQGGSSRLIKPEATLGKMLLTGFTPKDKHNNKKNKAFLFLN